LPLITASSTPEVAANPKKAKGAAKTAL